MRYLKYIYGIAAAAMLLTSCKDDILDRPPLTTIIDENYWRDESDLRVFANGFYTNYFNGYNTNFAVDYAPVRGYTFNDDLTGKNAQANFESSVPASRTSSSEAAEWILTYAGPTWNFAWVRKSNLFLDRIENVAKPKISAEAYNHWSAVARFFRAFEYYRLVSVFGDVPYFDKVLLDNDLPALYKDRDDRGFVMDKVYDDCKYVLANIRETDGTQFLNRYMAAGFISRFMLFEGTWQHYHGLDATRAKKYLELSRDAAEYVISSGKYSFGKDFKSLFSSESLAGNSEVLLYRVYDAALSVTHAIQSYNNGNETTDRDPNLDLIKDFIVKDGNVWQKSQLTNVATFKVEDLIKTRDPRFEASFLNYAHVKSSTLLYGSKFASRDALTYVNKTPLPPQYGSSTNTSDAPVLRYAEVVLNWIEAKAVLEKHFGGAPVTNQDLEKSINAIRKRPLDTDAINRGVTQTVALDVNALPGDPTRDADVPELIWEIRRERRMEFVFEQFRLLDIKRWKKLNYMNFPANSDYLAGPWVDLSKEAPGALVTGAKVRKADGTVVTYNGSNGADMIGFYLVTGGANRAAFTDKSYLAPLGQAQIVQYQERGYKLTQTKLW